MPFLICRLSNELIRIKVTYDNTHFYIRNKIYQRAKIICAGMLKVHLSY